MTRREIDELNTRVRELEAKIAALERLTYRWTQPNPAVTDGRWPGNGSCIGGCDSCGNWGCSARRGFYYSVVESFGQEKLK